MTRGWSRSIRAIFFDVGGTLIEERDPETWSELARLSGIEAEGEAIVHFFQEAEIENDRPAPRWSREEFWTRVLGQASGGPVGPARVHEFLERWERSTGPPRVFSDVRGCLERLRRRRFRLGIVSNSRSEESVRRRLAEAGLEEFFDPILSSGTEGVEKPDPVIFRRAVGRMGLAPEVVAHVGDLATVDARAARSAGLHGIWLNRWGNGLGVDPPEIISLSELPGALRRLARGGFPTGGSLDGSTRTS